MSDIIFWHGWGMQSSVWDGLINLLDRMRAGESLLMAKSLPGYDGSPSPYTGSPEALTDSMLDDMPNPAVLCGWSLGAMLAMLATHRNPDKVEKLILIGATPSFIRREGWNCALEAQSLSEFRKTVELDPTSTLRQFVSLFNRNDSNARLIARQLTSFPTPPAQVLDESLALLGSMDLRGIIPSISQSVLLIHGEHDPLMPLQAAQWLADTLPNARLEVLPNAAHAPFLSDPARCAALISDFLDE